MTPKQEADLEKEQKILSLFKLVIRYGVMEQIPMDGLAGALQGMADSLKEKGLPLEWWIEHERGLN